MSEGGKGSDKSQDGDAAKAPESPLTGVLRSAADKVGPLLVSLIVSVGFVAFAGKAVLWARFDALQVPPDQVVNAVPEAEAVAVGASMLLVFGLLGALAVLGIYLVDRGGRATPGMSRGLLVILAVEVLVAIWFTDDKSVESQIVASEVALLAIAVIFWLTFVAKLVTHKPEVPDLKVEQREEQLPKRAFFRGEGDNGIKALGALFVIGAAAVLGGIAYLIALVIDGSSEIAWVVAVPVSSATLIAGVVQHWARFEYAEEKAREAAREKRREKRRKKREREAREKSSGEWQKKERKRGKKERKKAKKEAKKQARREERLRAKLLAGWRAFCVGCRHGATLVLIDAGMLGDGCDRPSSKQKGEQAAGDNNEETIKPSGLRLTAWGVFLTLLLTAVAVAVPSLILHEWWLAVALGAVAVLGSGLWRISSLGLDRFVWYGLAIFISIPLFGTAMLIARNVDEPQVQPMALIRNTDGPDEAIQGLYVTETSSRVYFANVATEGCKEEVAPHSGRLLSVPTGEVVAMEIGPLQSVQQASRSALEMSYELTPGVETGAATVDLLGSSTASTRSPDASGEAGGTRVPETAATGATGATGATDAADLPRPRLENVGPAVRPNFGRGLRVEPETVSPGEEATLRMSSPNDDVSGFGASRTGRNLRLGGRVLDISKEPAGTAAGGEFIKLESGRFITVTKEVSYAKTKAGEFVQKEDVSGSEVQDWGPFVQIEDPAVIAPEAGTDDAFVKVDESAEDGPEVAEEKKAKLAGGDFEGQTWEPEETSLKGAPLLRQAWHPDHIRFQVPEDARTGVVTVECDQLAGAPLLQVRHAPDARIAVKVPPRRSVLAFNGKSSVVGPSAHVLSPPVDGKPAPKLTRSWKVDGVRQGHRKVIHSRMIPSLHPYTVELTVTDREGNSDTATLQVLRLPAFALRGLRQKREQRPKEIRKKLDEARKRIEKMVDAERPAAVELDGFTNSPGRINPNVRTSLELDDLTRRQLLREGEDGHLDGRRPIPVEELSHGESCPLSRHASVARLHVDLFLLHQGVVVKPVKHCYPLARKSDFWHPPPFEGEDSDSSEGTS
jgi:hypothetical protein